MHERSRTSTTYLAIHEKSTKEKQFLGIYWTQDITIFCRKKLHHINFNLVTQDLSRAIFPIMGLAGIGSWIQYTKKKLEIMASDKSRLSFLDWCFGVRKQSLLLEFRHKAPCLNRHIIDGIQAWHHKIDTTNDSKHSTSTLLKMAKYSSRMRLYNW